MMTVCVKCTDRQSQIMVHISVIVLDMSAGQFSLMINMCTLGGLQGCRDAFISRIFNLGILHHTADHHVSIIIIIIAVACKP